MEYLIDDLFPTSEIHILGGPSGVGKTRLLAGVFIESWRKGLPLWGHASHPRPFVYIACDRAQQSVLETFTGVGVNVEEWRRPNGTLPILSVIDDDLPIDLAAVLSRVHRESPEPTLAIVEAIGSLTPGGKMNDYVTVRDMMIRGARACKNLGITIIGTHHTGKSKGDDRYLNPRQRLLGSVAWAAFSSTILLFEPNDPEHPADPLRNLMIMPRNAAAQELKYVFNGDGCLEEPRDETTAVIMESYINQIPVGTDIYLLALRQFSERKGISRATLYRWMEREIEDGRIERAEPGTYRRRHEA